MMNWPGLLKKSTIFMAFALLAGAVMLLFGANGSSAQDRPAAQADAAAEIAAPATFGFAESETGLYVVQLADRPLSTYDGSVAGLAATSPTLNGSNRLDVNAPESIAYLNYLQTQHDNFINRAEVVLGRSLDVQFQYLRVLNAMAVRVNYAEAQRLADLPGVRAVYADELRELTTDVGPGVIGAPVFWEGEYGYDEHRGEDVIIGFLDTGVNYEHPSFAEVDGDGYTHQNPYGSGNFVGVCDPDEPTQVYDDICNDKLIGAWSLISGPNSGDSARDWNNHGSHVGSTIAGNVHEATFAVGADTFVRTVSGVAPRANVISYQVCDPSCPSTSSVAAVDQAIADGVNVLNYSISGGDSPWTDMVDLAFLDATAAGMFVSASAGNDGPGPSTVAKTGPWNASVAASTHNRVIANTVDAVGDEVDPILVVEDFGYGDSTAYLDLPAGSYIIDITPTGGSDPAISAVVTVEDDGFYTIIAAGDGSNQDLELVVLEDDPTPPAAGTFHLRLGHLAPFASGDATADVRLRDGTPVVEGVNYGDIAGFMPLPAGEYDLTITAPGGDPVLIDPLPVDIAEGTILSAFATGDGNNQSLGVFALPADAPGNFLPLYPDIVQLYLPIIAKNQGVAVSSQLANSGVPFVVTNSGGTGANVQIAHLAPFAADASVTIEVTPVTVPVELLGMAAVPGTGPAITTDVVAEGIWSGSVDAANVRGCNAFPANSFDNAIAVIQRGDCTFETKVTNANNAGAEAVVVYNHVGGPPISMGGLEPTTIPAVFVDNVDGDNLAAYLDGEPGAEIRINAATSIVVNDNWQDVVAGFSSRGPSQFDILKPDYIAPGVNILAAGWNGPGAYVFLQGTSMSSPHGAGAAALMIDRFPDWSVAEVKSALALTGYQDLLKEDGATPAGFFDIGSGRIALGSATNIGLVMNETIANYEAADPSLGGDPKTLNQPSLVNQSCVEECSWTRTFRSVAAGDVTYNVEADAPAGVTITADPASFTIAPNATQQVEITVEVDLNVVTPGTWTFAQVDMVVDVGNGESDVHLPVAIIPFASTPILTLDPPELSSEQGANQTETETLTIGNDGGVDLEWEIVDQGPTIQPSQQVLGNATSVATMPAGQITIGDLALNPNAGSEVGLFDLPNNASGLTTITHSASQNVVPGSVACSPDGGATTSINSYLRTFTLTDFGIFGDFDVDEVSFGIENLSGTVNRDITVNLYTLDGAFTYANLTLIGTATESLAPQTLSIVTMVVDGYVPAGGTLVVEVAPPDLSGEAAFYIGSNSAGETAPSYLASSSCGIANPTPFGSIGFPQVHVVMNVTGEAGAVTCITPGAEWADVDVDSGVVPPSGTQDVGVTFDSTGLGAGTYEDNLCLESNDPDRPFAIVPLTLEVTAFGQIEVEPEAIDFTLEENTQVTQTLIISNTGLADLNWFIDEAEFLNDVTPLNLPVGTDRASQAAAPTGANPGQVLPTGQSAAIASSWSEGFDDVDVLPGMGWALINNSDPLGTTDWFQGNDGVFPSHSGAPTSYIGANFNNTSGVGTISNWLLTPEITMNNGDEFSFWTRRTGSQWEDRLQVRLSTNGDSTDVGTGALDVGDFDELLLDINPTYAPGGFPAVWTEYTITISGLSDATNGRIAFRYFVESAGPSGTNSDYIGIDTVEYVTGDPMPLYDNGPFVTGIGDGPGGADSSLLQNVSLGMTTLGAAVYPSTGETFRMADEFTVTGAWDIDTVVFYAYQTNSPITSTMTAVNYRIWDGPPDDPNSNVIFGDTATNRFESTGWTNSYRYSESSPGTARPIMYIMGEAGVQLTPGTYWIDWQLEGSLASGPWQPPITILGETVTGNAMQLTGTGWVPFTDGGTTTAQGTPFQLWGTTACDDPSDVSWLSVDPTSGMTDPGTADSVTVTLDATGLAIGDYTAFLCISSDDPFNPVTTVPVNLSVEPVGGLTNLQVAHLAPFAMDPGTAVTITLNGAPALTDFAYGDSTDYLSLPADDYDVEVWPAGSTSPAITGTFTLMADTYYTVIATGDGVNQDLELLALVDDLSPPAAGNFKLRLGHLAPFAAGSATADIRLKDGTPVLTDVNYLDVSGYLELSEGTYDLIVTTPGGGTILIDPEPVTLPEGAIFSGFATGEGANQDLAIFALPADDPGFFVPDYGPGLPQHFEGYFPPNGWTIVDNGGDCVWQRNDQVPSGRPNYAGGDGFSAAADSDRCGSGTTMDTELWTPVIDLSDASVISATVDFVASYRHLGTSSFQVHVSDDGGATWDTLLTWTASVDPTGPGTPVSLDLADYVGSDNVIVSFHYIATGWHWWAQVDQVEINTVITQ